MAVGLQVFDSSGALVMDTGDRLGRVLGVVSAGTTSGSLPNALLSQGTPFTVVQKLDTDASTYPCLAVVSGTTLSWTAIQGAAAPCQIIYGVY